MTIPSHGLAACYFRSCLLSSPLWCLTSVFGMGTGVSITPSPPDPFEHERSKLNSLSLPLRLSPRSISIIQLSMSPCLHPWPIYLLVLEEPYFRRMGSLILEGASRLDAFSVYPFQTWLLCYALGSTTDTPAVRPSRSSRTKDSSYQISSGRSTVRQNNFARSTWSTSVSNIKF